ncbi:MAG TPA: type I DNA topoisomerase [Erysipelotrichaceae bacterium]|nr:type I DNA topoisomerase [Erysipelotrichaceae bacterium]
MKKLVIVESPSKSRTIEKYLGDDYIVLSSKGHIRDLAKTGKGRLGVDVEDDFKPKYVISKEKKKVVTELKKARKKADEVFIATDLDREGEAIAWHLAEVLDVDLDQHNRIVFNEITKDAILDAFANPRKIDLDLVDSQETRRILDRIIGFRLSTLLRSKIKSKSAGRVQSVALKLIADREAEIDAFIAEEYWSIRADFLKNETKVESELHHINKKKPKITNKDQADKIVADCQGEFTVSSVKSRKRNKKSRETFITSSLQQEASTKLRFNAKKTMRVAQGLYEGVMVNDELVGLITYMRTDSHRLSPIFINNAYKEIEATYGKEYVGKYRPSKDEKAQDAHEGIRPTHADYRPRDIKKFLTPDQYKLYNLIYARSMASLMKDAKMETNTVTFTQDKYDFRLSGSRIIFDGYLKLYGQYEQVSEQTLPLFEEGEKLMAEVVEGRQHFTQPPARYTEARLIKALEELGIGRPSTYASIIDAITGRNYVEHKSSTEGSSTKVFFPTDRGLLTNTELQNFFKEIINEEYTAQMEENLDHIADGDKDRLEMLSDFYNQFTPLLDNAYENMQKIEPEKIGEECPECEEGQLVIRDGRYGKFISCDQFPTCKYTRKIVDPNKVEPELLEEECPLCGSPLIKRKNRFGKYFIGCSSFPACKYLRNIDEDGNEVELDPSKIKKGPEVLEEKCPECGSPLIKRKNRRGEYFIGCSGFPKCRYLRNIDQDDEDSEDESSEDVDNKDEEVIPSEAADVEVKED